MQNCIKTLAPVTLLYLRLEFILFDDKHFIRKSCREEHAHMYVHTLNYFMMQMIRFTGQSTWVLLELEIKHGFYW